MVNYSLSNDFDTVYFNESSNHTETFHIFENFISIRNNSSQFILIQPNATMIAFYATFILIIETLGNFLLYCMIIYEKYGMDPQKRTVTNMLLSNMIRFQILFNIIIMPILTFHRIFGLQSSSKFHFISRVVRWLICRHSTVQYLIVTHLVLHFFSTPLIVHAYILVN